MFSTEVSCSAQGWIALYSNQDTVLGQLPYFPFWLNTSQHLPAPRVAPSPLIHINFALLPATIHSARGKVNLEGPKLASSWDQRPSSKLHRNTTAQRSYQKLSEERGNRRRERRQARNLARPQDHVNRQQAVHVHLCDFHCL